MRYRKRYLQAQVREKTKRISGGEGNASRPTLNLSDFFLIAIFVTFKGDYTIRFLKQFQKENTLEGKLEELKLSSFSQTNFQPILSLRFSARDVSQ